MAKSQPEIIRVITTTEELDQLMDREHKKLSLLDVHLEWCGPCQAMEENLRTMWFEIEEAEKRIGFFTIESSLIHDQDFKNKIGKVTCRPKFVIVSEGEIKGVVDGADFTRLEELIDKYMGALDEE